jgi:long-subunit fatty acid transport protein
LPSFLTSLLLLTLAALFTLSSARADEFHYNDVFMGPRASGLAGTMIGLADDPSSAYYNPAGLARARNTTVTVSTTALLGKQLAVGDLLEMRSTVAFSPAGITTTQAGSGNIAFMALSPSNDAYQVDRTFEGDELVSARMNIERSDSSYLVGLSYGVNIGRDIDLGVGVGYLYSSQSMKYSTFSHYRTPLEDGAIAIDLDQTQRGIQHGLMLLAGILWHPMGIDGPLRIGASMRTGVNVSTSASLQETTFRGYEQRPSSGGELFYERSSSPNEKKRGASRTPPMFGLGVAWRIKPFWVVAADLTFHGYAHYESFGSEVTKLATLNGSIGTEFLMRDGIALRLGFFTNRSSAPASVERLTESWDQYGGTLGATFERSGYAFTFALRYARMIGETHIDTMDGADARYSVSGRDIGVVFGGSYFF